MESAITEEPITPPAMAVVNGGQNSPPLTIRGTKPPWPNILKNRGFTVISDVRN